MRQQTETLIDDLDGTPADETVEVALDGRAVEIDLSAHNAARLREAIGPYVAAGRRVGRRRGRVTAERTAERASNAAIREWGLANGYRLGDRGRIPAEVKDAYREAHS